MSKPNRYPGPKPFSAEQAKQFHGRESEAIRLRRMVEANQLTVLYGRSGYGKSSLLNAAVLPHLEHDGYHVINVRMGAYTLQSDNTPLRSTVRAIAEDPTLLEQTILDKLVAWDNSLWYYTKTFSINGKKPKLLFVFDQFEELFTYPVPEVELYEQGLVELMGSGLPQRYRNQLKAKTELEDHPQRPAVFDRMHIKVIIAIRSNRFHLLERLAPAMPQILQNTMELDALEREGARRAIIIPAKDKENEYISPAFDYSAAAQEDILDFLTQEEKIEGILLQILCAHFERHIRQKGNPDQVIEMTDLNLQDKDTNTPLDQPLRDIVDTYYYERIDDLPDEQEETVKRFIEDSLVQRVGNGGMRLSMHQAQIKDRFGIEAETLNTLVDNGLLRTEPFLRGGVTYELTHDRLLDPVLKAKEVYEAGEAQRLKAQLKEEAAKRKEAEGLQKQAQEAQAAAEAERAKAREAEEQAREALQFAKEEQRIAYEQRKIAVAAKQVAEKNERRARFFSRLVIGVAVLTLLAGGGYYISRQEARNLRAETNLVRCQDLRSEATILLTSGYCASAQAKVTFALEIVDLYGEEGKTETCKKFEEENKQLNQLNIDLEQEKKSGQCKQ